LLCKSQFLLQLTALVIDSCFLAPVSFRLQLLLANQQTAYIGCEGWRQLVALTVWLSSVLRNCKHTITPFVPRMPRDF
jgi:hypothetical protein